jgi:hypothetical protein
MSKVTIIVEVEVDLPGKIDYAEAEVRASQVGLDSLATRAAIHDAKIVRIAQVIG